MREGQNKGPRPPVMVRMPPKLKTDRAADRPKSGLIDLAAVGSAKEEMVAVAKMEAARLFAGNTGDFHAAEAARKFPYGKATCNLGRVDNKVIPRLYFSRPIPRDLGTNLRSDEHERYDYDARFTLGTGPMALDEERRVIREWSPKMGMMADTIWKAMKKQKEYRSLCKPGFQFNHVSVHFYRRGADMENHEDRRRNRRNSMKEGSAVAVFTVGDQRNLTMSRKYPENGKMTTEAHPCMLVEQKEGSLFVLHPHDEDPKIRRNEWGQRKKDAIFVHGITTGREKDYFSIAFIFRCLETKAVVIAGTDRVIPPIPRTVKEKQRYKERAALRADDSKPGSNFQKEVTKLRKEWVRLMANKGWIAHY